MPSTVSDRRRRESCLAIVFNNYVDRRAAGENVSISDVTADCPELAEELRSYIAFLDQVMSGDSVPHLIRLGLITPSSDREYAAEFGPFKIIGILGGGAAGVVFKAYDPAVNRIVALKLLRSGLADSREAVIRFEREAKAIGGLRHPNITTVYSVGEHQGVRFICMEYVEGGALSDMLREQGALDSETAREVFDQLLAALAVAHGNGILHRDVKPANILVNMSPAPDRSGRAAIRIKLTDFGLARVMNSNTRLTRSQYSPGTPEYMSPEQARGDGALDARSDLFSAGLVLYEMLTGVSPFQAPSDSAVLRRVLYEEPHAPVEMREDVDPSLSNLALRLMAKLPEDRLPTAVAAAHALNPARITSALSPSRHRRRFLQHLSCATALTAATLALLTLDEKPHSLRAIDPRAAALRIPKNDRRKLFLQRTPESEMELVVHADDLPGEVQTLHSCALVDLDGAGDAVVALGVSRETPGDNLFILRPTGEILWSAYLGPGDVCWPGGDSPSLWTCWEMTSGDVDGRPGEELVVSAGDGYYCHSRLSVVDVRIRAIGATFWHFGRMEQVSIEQGFFDGGRSALLVRCYDNAVGALRDPNGRRYAHESLVTCAAVLDAERMDGYGPPTEHDPCVPSVMPYAYAILDRRTSIKELDDREWPAAEMAAVYDIAGSTFDPEEGFEPWKLINSKWGGRYGVAHLVDRNLNLLRVVDNTEYEDLIRKHWRPVIQDYKFLDAPQWDELSTP